MVSRESLRKKGQVTIFIIVGIAIFASIVFLLFLTRNFETSEPKSITPVEEIKNCVEDVVKKTEQKIMSNGGILTRPSTKIYYAEENYTYLCYQDAPYESCFNRFPNLKGIIEEEIKEDTKKEIQTCFDLMKGDFEDRGYVVNGGPTSYSVELVPGAVKINLKKDVFVSKDGSTNSFHNFDTKIFSSLYRMVEITRKIVNDESQYCSYDYVSVMNLYPRFKIELTKFKTSKIYKIKNRDTLEEFKFAIRTCAIPEGGIS